jgi:hypothetical protein
VIAPAPAGSFLTPAGRTRRANQFAERFWKSEIVQPLREKYCSFDLPKYMLYSRSFRAGTRGVSRSSRTRRGMRWTRAVPMDERRKRGRRNRVVLTRPCRRQVGDDANALRWRRWQTLVHRGERAISRKPSCRECRAVSAEPVGQRALLRNSLRAMAVGAASTRHSLRPPIWGRVASSRTRARVAPRECGLLTRPCHAPRRRGIQ